MTVERTLAGVALPGLQEVSRMLDVISRAFPYPAFLFDPAGQLLWASDQGRALLSAGNALTEALARHARALALDPLIDAELALRRLRVLRPLERLAFRRFEEFGTPLLLLAFTPALAGLAGEPGVEAGSRLPGLGAAESRVARLAADGYTVLNMSAQLGVTETTVRTHLRRVYQKTGVHGRAELASALFGLGAAATKAAASPGAAAGRAGTGRARS